MYRRASGKLPTCDRSTAANARPRSRAVIARSVAGRLGVRPWRRTVPTRGCAASAARPGPVLGPRSSGTTRRGSSTTSASTTCGARRRPVRVADVQALVRWSQKTGSPSSPAREASWAGYRPAPASWSTLRYAASGWRADLSSSGPARLIDVYAALAVRRDDPRRVRATVGIGGRPRHGIGLARRLGTTSDNVESLGSHGRRTGAGLRRAPARRPVLGRRGRGGQLRDRHELRLVSHPSRLPRTLRVVALDAGPEVVPPGSGGLRTRRMR
jgi:hypothetical protein